MDSGELITNLGGVAKVRDESGTWDFELYATQLAHSQDGRLRAVRHDDRVVVLDLESGETLAEAQAARTHENHVAFSPSGGQLALAEQNGLVLIEIASGQVVRVETETVRAIVWSHDGQRVAVAAYEGVWIVDSGGQALARKQYGPGVHDLDWSPDGSRLALACVDQSAKLVRADSLEVEDQLLGHSNTLFGVSWSSDGSRLATCSGDGSVRIWGVDECSLATTFEIDTAGWGIDWSPDDSELVCVDEHGKLYFWDAKPGGFGAAHRKR